MYPTKNDIPSAKRGKVIESLSRLLPDAVDLKAQAKQAHWNVKGEEFIALHELFDKVSGEADAAIDLIAERIIQLGGEADGSVRTAAKKSRLQPYPYLIAGCQEHADALSSAVAAFNANGRAAIDETAAAGDAITADMLTGIVGGLDKLLWFVEAHIEKTASQQARKAR